MSSVVKILSVIFVLNANVAESSSDVAIFSGALNQCFVDHFLNATNLTPNTRIWTEQRTESPLTVTVVRTLNLARHSLSLACRRDSRDTGYEGWETDERCYIQGDRVFIHGAQYAKGSVTIYDQAEITYIQRFLSKFLGSFQRSVDVIVEGDHVPKRTETRSFVFHCRSSARCNLAISRPGY